MARPQKNTVDYFPHLIGSGKKMQYIEMKYGNDGYATWFKILETLAVTDYHFLNLNDDVEVMFLSAKCRVSVDILLTIIDDLVALKMFNKELWSSRVIWSETFINHIQDAYKRRENKCLQFEGLCMHLLSLGIHTEYSNNLNSDSNTQSKVKESKANKIKPIPTPTPSEKSDFEEQKNQTKLPWEQYSVLDFETPKTDLLNDDEFISKTSSSHNLTKNQTEEWVKKFFIHIEKSNEGHANLQAHRKHCTNWINLKIQNEKNNKDGKTTFKAGQRTNGQVPTGGYSKL